MMVSLPRTHVPTYVVLSLPAQLDIYAIERHLLWANFWGPTWPVGSFLDHSSEGLGLATKIDDGARICIAAGTGSVHSAIHFHDRWLDRQCRN